MMNDPNIKPVYKLCLVCGKFFRNEWKPGKHRAASIHLFEPSERDEVTIGPKVFKPILLKEETDNGERPKRRSEQQRSLGFI